MGYKNLTEKQFLQIILSLITSLQYELTLLSRVNGKCLPKIAAILWLKLIVIE